MKDTAYVYAVGRIRVKELSLLSEQDIKRLISARDYDEAVSQLSSKGYEINGADYHGALKSQKEKTWKLMQEVLPDISQMNSLIIKNDCHNLKAAVKAAVTGIDARKSLLTPSVFSPEKIYDAVSEKKFGDLPDDMRPAAEKAYDILVRTRSAQLADAVCDKAAMADMISYAGKADSKIFSEIAQTSVACTDIKILYRCILTGKSKDFMQEAVCPCSAFSVDTAIEKALNGLDEFLAYLEKTPYSGAAEKLRSGAAQFEKYCDDMLMSIIKKGKMTAFGIDPIAAYYVAKETELLSVRIILSGKLNGADEEVISERVRTLYV